MDKNLNYLLFLNNNIPLLKKQFLLILLLLPFLSLAQDLNLDYNSKKIRKEIKKLVEKIGKENIIHSDAVGFSGEKTAQYERFERLIKEATIEELVELMGHPKPAVRGYAFWALAKKHYKDLDNIYVQHAKDGELVFQLDGCMGGDLPLISFMRMVITPRVLDSDCKKFNEKTMKKMEEKQYIFDKIKD